MKLIKYKIPQGVTSDGVILLDVEMPWTEQSEAIAKAEAHNGEYMILEEDTVI